MPDDQSRPDPAAGAEHDVPRFVELVRGQRTCMFTTVDPDGTIVSRPMAVQAIDDDATIWFMAFADSPKIEQLRQRPQVNLAFTENDAWVSASGTASIVEDVAKKTELWNPFAEAWFQCEPDDPKVGLLRVDLTGGEYWDSPSKPAQLFGLLKVLIAKERPADGENAKLELGEPSAAADSAHAPTQPTHATPLAQGATVTGEEHEAAAEAAQHVVDEVTSWHHSSPRETVREALDSGFEEADVQVSPENTDALVEAIKHSSQDGTPEVSDADPVQP